MLRIMVNPGTGAVNNTIENNAIENIKHFIVDNKVEGVKYLRMPDEDYGEGRYAFLLWKENYCHEIQMPGLPLEKVRYLGNEGQNIWNFPRLYVDGSSWVWKFALGLRFDGKEEE